MHSSFFSSLSFQPTISSMASLEDIWGPVIPYDEATFKNYLGFQTGYKVENNITQYMEHLISSNIPAYAMINPTEAKAKTDFLLGLATAVKNYAVTNKIKIVAFLGSGNNWFDITNNVVKNKNKITNKVGKLALITCTLILKIVLQNSRQSIKTTKQ